MIPNRWDWWFFFSGIIIFTRLRVVLSILRFDSVMQNFIRRFDSEFDEEQKILLSSAPGKFIPPKLFLMPFFQLEAGSLNSYTSLLSIVLCIVALFLDNGYVICISAVVFFTGSKPWQSNPFYTGNEQMDIAGAIQSYFKAEGKPIYGISKLELDYYTSFFMLTRNKFNRLWSEG